MQLSSTADGLMASCMVSVRARRIRSPSLPRSHDRASSILPPAAKVHANTGPLSLPKLRNARMSLQLRQQ